MPQEPAPADPGRDEPRPGDAAVRWPGPGRATGLEPVITRPDPMTEDELTAAEIAEVGEATESEARAAANAARSGTTGTTGRRPRSPRTRAAAARGSPARRGSSPVSPPAGRRRSAPGWRWM